MNYSKIRAFINSKKNPSFLILRLKPLGDTILTIPAIYSIKNAFPECRISVVISKKFSEVINNNPYIDEILAYDKRPYF